MREAVSEVLATRTREADGLSRMVLYSLGGALRALHSVASLRPQALRSAANRQRPAATM